MFLFLFLLLLASADPGAAVPRFYTVRDAQTILRVSKPTVHRLIAAGTLASVKLGRKRLLVKESVDTLADQLAAGQNTATSQAG
jgi:excisionase family DNA binding protein